MADYSNNDSNIYYRKLFTITTMADYRKLFTMTAMADYSKLLTITAMADYSNNDHNDRLQ